MLFSDFNVPAELSGFSGIGVTGQNLRSVTRQRNTILKFPATRTAKSPEPDVT